MRAFSHKAETDAEFNAKYVLPPSYKTASACADFTFFFTKQKKTTRWVAFFKGTEDLGELHRGLQNVFSYDLVPSAEIITEAIKASRQYNDYPTAVRVLEGLKKKVINPQFGFV